LAEIALERLTKVYGDGTRAVSELELEIADGEFIVLVGPSGCGKTTALRMVAGLEEVTDGTIRIGDRIVNRLPPKQRDIAMVFQNYALYPHMSAFKNMAFGLKLRKMQKPEIRHRVGEAARVLGLMEILAKRPRTLSGGQRQRVAMGRAIVREPRVFLMDEPLSNLDAKLRVQMRTQVSRIQKTLGTTTLYVTHDQTEAMTLGDRVVVMRAGLVQQVGSPAHLYDNPVNLFVAGFIGSPSMNFLPGQLRGGGTVTTALGEVQLPDECRQAVERSKSSGNVILGIRPEHFEDAALVGDKPGATFDAPIDIVEAMGSDVYAYFVVKGEEARSADLEDLAKDTGNDLHSDGVAVTARLDAASHVQRGQTARLWYDTSKLAVFDSETGLNLAPGGEDLTTATGAQRA